MALKNGKPNPLNYFKMRRVEYATPHFKYFSLSSYNPKTVKNISEWIELNLNNRYYVGQGIMLDNKNSFVYNTQIGFEEEKEMSFFLIACPFVHA